MENSARSNTLLVFALLAIGISTILFYRTIIRRKGRSENITERQLLKKIENEASCFVFLYNKNCGYCHQTMPNFINLRDKASHLNVEFLMLEPDFNTSVFGPNNNHQSMHKDFTIPGYPTMLLFKNGQMVSEYNPKIAKKISPNNQYRSTDSMLEYLENTL